MACWQWAMQLATGPTPALSKNIILPRPSLADESFTRTVKDCQCTGEHRGGTHRRCQLLPYQLPMARESSQCELCQQASVRGCTRRGAAFAAHCYVAPNRSHRVRRHGRGTACCCSEAERESHGETIEVRMVQGKRCCRLGIVWRFTFRSCRHFRGVVQTRASGLTRLDETNVLQVSSTFAPSL